TLKAAKEALRQTTDYRPQTTETPTHPSILKGEGKSGGEGRLVVLFQPHRYTRTRDLLNDFFTAFTDADKVILMDIYPAGEKPLNGINSEVLLKGIKDSMKDIAYIKERGEILNCLDEELKEGDTLITLGAGDVWKIGEEFLKFKIQKQN
ncbi:MAG: UDP-N-acetylmuramate--L-alanine ligase, partial [Nitrospirota bacterium]